MLRTERGPQLDQIHHRNFILASKAFPRIVVGVLVAICVVAGLWRLAQPTAAKSNASGNVNPIAVTGLVKFPDPNSSEAESQMLNLFAQRRYLSEHANPNYWTADPLSQPERLEPLLRSLQEGQPADQRQAALTQLIQAPSSVVPILLDTLASPDPSVRRGVAYVLGSQRAPEAEDSLFFATFDPDPDVRAAAVWALGELGTPFILPRLEWLEAAETNSGVSQAAQAAENQVYANVATGLGVPPSGVRAVTVATSSGRLYAATESTLYAPRDLGWGQVGTVPDVPTALAAAGDNGQVIYLGTKQAGAFRSLTGGSTWEAINSGLPTGSRFAVTAVAVDPSNASQVYITLAKSEASQVPLTPFGIFQSMDGGNSWASLTPWNVDYVTTRLVIDPGTPGYLFGLTEGGAWQYPLNAAKHP